MEAPFKTLGDKLKSIRERSKLSLVEVSGAVEIDVKELQKIEIGESRPAEDIMFLLISYFNLDEDEAEGLWGMAGYETPKNKESTESQPIRSEQQIQIVVPMPEMRTIYTDLINVTANKAGVTLTFMQSIGKSAQPMAISRVGMSIEQAVEFMQTLSETVGKVINNSQKLIDKPNQNNKEI